MSKLITVVVCTYNGQRYIAEVIDSILSQDGFEKFIEQVVIVDNASSDNTKNIISSYQLHHPSIQYIFEGRTGLTHARKHGAAAESEWVAYLDDDNVLMDGWLKEAVTFISEHPEIGAFNGASIAETRHQVSDEELIILKAVFPNLACTHYCIEEYKKGTKPAMKGPFGAGMLLRTKPLKEFLEAGWTSNTGRKGNDLGAGEDGEIVNAILEKGYTHGFNNKMAFLHIMPESRLQMPYVHKLMAGLTKGYYIYISVKKYYIYHRFRTFVKSVYVIASYPLKSMFETDQVVKLKSKVNFDARKGIIKLTLRDLFVLRRE